MRLRRRLACVHAVSDAVSDAVSGAVSGARIGGSAVRQDGRSASRRRPMGRRSARCCLPCSGARRRRARTHRGTRHGQCAWRPDQPVHWQRCTSHPSATHHWQLAPQREALPARRVWQIGIPGRWLLREACRRERAAAVLNTLVGERLGGTASASRRCPACTRWSVRGELIRLQRHDRARLAGDGVPRVCHHLAPSVRIQASIIHVARGDASVCSAAPSCDNGSVVMRCP